MNQVNQLQSKTISYIRFPLIILIVYIHNQGMGTPLSEVSISWANFSGIDAYNLLRLVINGVIARAAVPAFFILSGYLFFFGKTSFSRETWLTALKKRFWTLFVPFVLWNIIAACFARIANTSINLDVVSIFLNNGNLSGWTDIFGKQHNFYFPLNVPLWYIRDLIILSIISPLIFCSIKYVPKVFGVFLCFLAVTAYNFDLVGINYNSLIFFGIGAYFGIYQINILSFGQRYKLPFLISTIVLGVFFVYFRSLRSSLYWINNPFFISFPFIISFFFSLLVLIATSLEQGRIRLHPLLVKSVFFVFALHNMPYFMAFSLPWLKFLPSSTLVFVGTYLLTPIIKISLCLLLYIILDKLSPKINGLLSGNRSK
ncbi:acyltransferase family protein [Hoylesella shahii]